MKLITKKIDSSKNFECIEFEINFARCDHSSHFIVKITFGIDEFDINTNENIDSYVKNMDTNTNACSNAIHWNYATHIFYIYDNATGKNSFIKLNKKWIDRMDKICEKIKSIEWIKIYK